MRAARLRVGHAADELGQDEARVARRLLEARTALEQARRQLSDLAMPLESGLVELAQQTRRTSTSIARHTAELLRQLGGQAVLWLEAEAKLAQLGARVMSAEREREDLHFQIAQLKGRLGILNVEGDSDLNHLRAQAEKLQDELTDVLESLMRVAEPVRRTLAENPSVRDTIADPRTLERGRNAASSA